MSINKLPYSRLRCVYCGESQIRDAENSTSCAACNHAYPKFRDVVFLGSFQQADVLGLIEVTSKISSNINPEAMRANRRKAEAELREQFELQYERAAASSQQHATGTREMAISVRLREWGSLELLSKEIDFEGKLCFDNGAGLGGDSQRLLDRGAEVVCLDFNPVSVHNGQQIVPEADWICGNSEYLPFVDNTFDISVANAALHHMHDIRASVREMLRVTKPGGYVLLISDPFMEAIEGTSQKVDAELRVFDKHPMVLGGVNENLIPFNIYCEELLDQTEATLLTMKIHNDEELADQPVFWQLDEQNRQRLARKRGNISSRIRVGDSNPDATVKESEEIPTAEFFETIGNPQRSMSFLLPYLPQECFDTFPFESGSKFNLLNGWRACQDYESLWREGYNRARLFLSEHELQEAEFELRRPAEAASGQTEVYWSVNGQRQGSVLLTDQAPARIGISHDNPFQDRNLLEFGIADKMENKGVVWGAFEESNSFLVRKLPINWQNAGPELDRPVAKKSA